MAKILQFDNRTIFADIATEVAVLRSPANAGSNITLTLDNNSELSNNAYVLMEDVATGRAEIAQINQAVTPGTDVRVATLKFPHNAGVKIYLLKYNKIQFFHAATVAGAKSQLDSDTDIDVDDDFTEYVDSANTTGYAFFRLKNSTTADVSDYSSAYPYSLLKLTSKSKIREFVKKFYKGELDNETFDYLCDTAEQEIFLIYPWRFREAVFSFNTVLDQAVYSFEELGLTDFQQLAGATYDDEPIEYVTFKENLVLNWGSALSPRGVSVMNIWNNEITITPAPPENDLVVTLYYWKNSAGFSEETTDTAVTLPQAIAYAILQDLWAMEDTKKSQFWEGRKMQMIGLLKKSNVKQSQRFAALTSSSLAKRYPNDQIENPSIG